MTAEEFDDRVGAAWAATTRGDLVRLTEDLPPDRPPLVPSAVPRERHPLLAAFTAAWLIVSVVSAGAWGLLSLARLDVAATWWIWFVGPSGGLLAALWYFGERRRGPTRDS